MASYQLLYLDRCFRALTTHDLDADSYRSAFKSFITLLNTGFTHCGSRSHGHLFQKCWQQFFTSHTKKTSLNICSIPFSFSTGQSSYYWHFFFFLIIGCPDNIFQAVNVFVAIHHNNADKWSSVSVTPNYMSSAYIFCNLSASESFRAFQSHSNALSKCNRSSL